MAALTSTEEDAVRRALADFDGNSTDGRKLIRRAAEKLLGAPEGSLDAKINYVKVFCTAELQIIDDARRTRAPPTISFGDKALDVAFAAPGNISHASLYLHVGDDKLFYDGDKKQLLAPGELGNALAARPKSTNKVVVSEGLTGGKPITATVYYRGPAAFAFGPESAHSNSVVAALLLVPGAPLLVPNEAGIRVLFAAPPRCFKVSIRVVDMSSGVVYRLAPGSHAGSRVYQCMPGLSDPLTAIEPGDTSRHSMAKVKLPARDVEYAISIAAFNGVGWSDFGPASKINISDHAPLAPGVPLVEEVGEDSATVRFAPPPPKSSAEPVSIVLAFRVPGDPTAATKHCHARLDKLVDDPAIAQADAMINGLRERARTLSCLAAATEYDVTVIAGNKYGWSAPSPAVSFKTLQGEVEVTGVQTADEGDSEAIKRAVDVDAADEPEAKRTK